MGTNITIYTATEYLSIPGPGGYAAIIGHQHRVQKLAGRDTNAEPERLPLLAILEALQTIPDGSTVTVYSAMALIPDLINNGWLEEQAQPDWPTSNQDLWHQLRQETNKKAITWAHFDPHDDPQGSRPSTACLKAARRQARKAATDLSEIQAAHRAA